MQFFIYYLLLIISTSFFIIGVYIATRHWKEVQPDGRIETKGYVFKWWSEYWESISKVKKVYYSGDQLGEKLEELISHLPEFENRLNLNPEKMSLAITGEISKLDLYTIQKTLNVKAYLNEFHVFLYIEENEYTYPEWIRLPISGCYKCMASIWGSLVYFVFGRGMIIPSELNLENFAFWLFFIVILIPVNIIVYDKVKNDI